MGKMHCARATFSRLRRCRTLLWLALFTGTVTHAWTETRADVFQQALALYRDRRYSDAQAIFQQLAVDWPDDFELNFYLGRLALWFDDEANALTCLEKAAHRAPADARIQNALGDAYGLSAQKAPLLAKYGWAKKCLAAYRRAVERDPRNLNYRWSLLGYFHLAPRIAGGGTEKAYEQATVIGEIDAMNGRIALATLYLAEKKFADAFAQFERIPGRARDDFLALYHIGRCAAVSGEQLDRGMAALQRCLHLAPPTGDGQPTRSSIHHRLGNILEKKGELAAAQAEYVKAMEENPDFRATKVALRN